MISYASEFHQIASYLNWDKSALMAKFYQGLKSEIKDGMLYINNWSETLNKMIKQVTQIDNQLYERKMENCQDN